MKDELITYETAKAAKEKGFNMLTSLRGATHHFFAPSGQLIIGDSYNRGAFYYRSTQALLQRWLREEHNIYVLPAVVKEKELYFMGCTIWIDKKAKAVLNGIVQLKYELALEQGLLIALKLIKDGRMETKG